MTSDLTWMLEKIAERPLLSAAEEKVLTRQLVTRRENFRSALLRLPGVVHKVLEDLIEIGQSDTITKAREVLDECPERKMDRGELCQSLREKRSELGDCLRRLRATYRHRHGSMIHQRREIAPQKHSALSQAALWANSHCYRIGCLELHLRWLVAQHGVMQDREGKELRSLEIQTLATRKELNDTLGKVLKRQSCYQRCRGQLVEANMRLALHQAKHYQKLGLGLEDSLQEGFRGLLRAADKYDPSLGWKFGTYATWWIRQSITNAVGDTVRLVRLPRHLLQQALDVEKRVNYLTQRLGRSPTPQEVARVVKLPELEIKELLQFLHKPLHLDVPLSGDVTDVESMTMLDTLPDQHDGVAAEELETSELSDRIEVTLRKLPVRERKVLKMRFGLCGQPQLTLEEIGKVVGVSKERVRQIETRALTLLQQPNIKCLLEGFL